MWLVVILVLCAASLALCFVRYPGSGDPRRLRLLARLDRYAPAEKQEVPTATGTRTRYVRLLDEPIPVERVLPWLEEQGLVRRREREPCRDPDCSHEHCDGPELAGWGTTYFAVPFDRTEER